MYDESYPAARGHFDPRVGALKARTLQRWLRSAAIDLRGKRVCDVGFGGGSCLALVASQAGRAIGIEANVSAIQRVRATGIDADLLYVEQLPSRLDAPIDLWLFQDSFEHLPDPAQFTEWLVDNSSPSAQILLVAPRADSLSRRLLGRLWPHSLPDHQFHWSHQGLVEFMARRGFHVHRRFYPLKFVSPGMAIAHILHKLGAPPRSAGASFAVPFNFGEHGLVFARRV